MEINMFKFGFSSDADEDNTRDDGIPTKCEKEWEECKEIAPITSELMETIITNAQFTTINLNNTQIKYLCPNQIVDILHKENCPTESSVFKAEQNHSDLIPAVYEGGFKIWECTYDLLNYVNDNNICFENKKVLDLGCGAGIVGLYTLLQNSFCCFQDYNADVIEYITIPNVCLNSRDRLSNCKFYSGDWQSFSVKFFEDNSDEDNKFDFIFTSETIYNTENYKKLHGVLESLLKKDGTIFLAAKSFYFGVGGGISLFEEYLDNHNVFQYSSCWKCREGVKREILKIQFK